MTLTGLLVPKGWALAGWVGGGTYVLAGIQFSNTITVGSIVVAALVIVLSGVFTLRNNLRSFWRGLAEERGEQVTVLETTLKERDEKIRELQDQARADMEKFADEQQAVRHDLKNQLAEQRALLTVEKAKTDLSALLELLGKQHGEAMEQIATGLGKQDEIIRILAGDWANNGRDQTEGQGEQEETET